MDECGHSGSVAFDSEEDIGETGNGLFTVPMLMRPAVARWGLFHRSTGKAGSANLCARIVRGGQTTDICFLGLEPTIRKR